MSGFEVTLQRVRRLSSSTLDFRFARTDGHNVDFEPGQFFRFTFRDEKGAFERSYSLCNYGNDVHGSPFLDLVISWVDGGRASQYLFNCEPGIKATVTGPYGRLVLPEPMPRRLFLVATSVGIAPFMPMLTRLAKVIDEGETEVHFFFGVRSPEEFIYEQLLTRYMGVHPGFQLTLCYSREMPKVPRAFERRGYVQDAIATMPLDPADDRFLLCGNPAMIDDVFAALKERGFTGKQVVREKYVYARETGAVKVKAMTQAQRKLLAEKTKKYKTST
ncbi:MAG: FAD-binding oxidoreductase [Pseudomonadales bacterium]